MSKIICNVCGTSYPETESRCPICGSVRSGDAQGVAGAEAGEASGYQYIKGGRFSKANVRKRNRDNQQVVKSEPREDIPANDGEEKPSKGLAVVAVILLLAIIAVVIFIALRFFLPGFNDIWQDRETQSTTQSTGDVTEGPTKPVTVPCEGLVLSASEVQLTETGNTHTIGISTKPANTTDTVTFASSAPNVATVDNQGTVTAVASGEAVITITCGDQQVEFRVVCNIEPPETEPPVTEPPAPPVELKLNRKDFTLTYAGHSWDLYSGDIPREDITWTSDNEAIATITNGKVVAVAPGSIQVHAEYQGQKVSCWVRCVWKVTSDTEDPGTESQFKKPYVLVNNYGDTSRDSTIRITLNEDGSVKSKESFSIYLKDADGKNLSVTFVSGNTDVCTVSGNRITAAGKGITTVTCEFEGEKYTYTIRVVTNP